jgi:hypothetical protein
MTTMTSPYAGYAAAHKAVTPVISTESVEDRVDSFLRTAREIRALPAVPAELDTSWGPHGPAGSLEC